MAKKSLFEGETEGGGGFRPGELVMWQTVNSTGTGIVILDAGQYVMVGVLPTGPHLKPLSADKELLREGPYQVMMCVASTLFKRAQPNTKALKSGD